MIQKKVFLKFYSTNTKNIMQKTKLNVNIRNNQFIKFNLYM